MGNTEGFVQIGVHHISAVICWSAESNLGIQVSAVQINLTTMFMNQVADLSISFFKDCIS